jgi:protein involved in polysaccharide export with SLBB domain
MRIAPALFASLLLTSLLLGLSACANDIAPPQAGAAPASYVHRLGPDDRLRISVYGEEPLAGEYAVNAEGLVSFPLAGMVKADGLTISEFSASLTQALAGHYIKDPKVSVDLIDYRPVYVLGEVNKAGQYPYKAGMTVLGAVATAGGFTYRANAKVVMLRHPGAPAETRAPLTADLPVYPGDTIRIRERYF